MDSIPSCPQCSSNYCYEDRELYICPECSHEFNQNDLNSNESTDIKPTFKDANGVVLEDGDSVIVLKDLKVKGSSLVVKVGTKVKGIRLVEGDHDIDCKIKGIGAMQLKTQFVKKLIE